MRAREHKLGVAGGRSLHASRDAAGRRKQTPNKQSSRLGLIVLE
jgi:hypothetical protein